MNRVPQLDGLRGVAVLMVFAYHALGIPLFWSGVDLFFVLSGYLITGVLLRLKAESATEGYWAHFYSRRLRRIIPPYLGFIVFLFLFTEVPWSQLWYWYAFFAPNLAVLYGNVPVPHAMVPLWSLGVEEQFYLVWPSVVLLCSKETLRRVALVVMLASPVLRAAFTPLFHDHLSIFMLLPFRADLLACGAFIAVSRTEGWIQENRQRSLYAFLVAGAFLAGLSALPGFRMTANSVLFNSAGYSLIVVIFGSALVYALALRGGPVHSVLCFPSLRYMGKISYTFYLYQVLIMDMVSWHVGSRLATGVLGFLLAGILASLSWWLFESPILSGKPPKLRIDRTASKT